MLIVGRAVAGLGAAGLVNGGLTILSACTPLEKRASMKHSMSKLFHNANMTAVYLGIVMGCKSLP